MSPSSTKRLPIPLVLALAISLIVPTAVRAAWTEFRGPTGQGHSDSTSLPLTWSADDQIRWRTEVPGQGWSSPVVQDDRVYLTAAMPVDGSDDYSLQLLILDGGSGQIHRSVEVFRQQASTAPRIHDKNSHASPTPVLEGDRIYVHFGHQGTACLDVEGQIVWRNDSIRYSPTHGNGGSPIIAGDHLIFSCDGSSDPFIVALNKHTGELAWKTPRVTDADKTFSFSTPLLIEVGGQPQVVSPGSNCVVAYSPETGEEIWRVRYQGFSVIARPVFGDGLVYISTSFASPQLLAIQTDGQGDVTDTHLAWTARRGAPNTPSPLLVGPYLFMISDRGVASCLDAKSGELYWQERLDGGFSSSPLYAHGRVYFQNEAGVTYVVAAEPEFQELARNDLGERTLASFAVIDDDLLIRSESHLYRIGQSAVAR
jgi:outer membrane protein assembly factor BamB